MIRDTRYGYCRCGCGGLAPIAVRNIRKRGIVKGQPRLYIQGHGGGNRKLKPPITDAEREKLFWKKVAVTADSKCWEWLASKDEHGYGWFKTATKTIKAHRYSYALRYGPFSDNLECLHGCDNPGCVNPSHLHLGSHTENMREMFERKRAAIGERASSAKLTADEVREIRELCAAGVLQKTVGDMYSMDRTTISGIVSHKQWKHVT